MLFASPDFLFYSLHTITIIATPLHIFGCYCIVFKTPKAINSVKFTMLNLHIWCIIFEYGLSILAVPFLLFPAVAGFPLGIWSRVFGVPTSIQTYLVVSTVFTVGIGIAQIFENRFYHIYGKNTPWRHFRVPFFVVNYFLNATFLIPTMIDIPDQKEALEYIFQRLPSLSPCMRSYPIFILTTDYFRVLVPFYFMCILVVGESFVFCGLIYQKLNANFTSTRSKNTTILQRRFLKATYFQVAMLVFHFVGPIIYISLTLIFDYYNQAANNIILVTIALHGISSTIVMLWAHKPYRTVCWDIFLKFKTQLYNIPEGRQRPRIIVYVVF